MGYSSSVLLAANRAGMCQCNTPALFRAPALSGIGLLRKATVDIEIPVVPSDPGGTIEVSGTIQPALMGTPPPVIV